MNKWKIKNKNLDQTKLVDDIYSARGVENYLELFSLDEKSFNDPYLFRDMSKTVDRIMKAIKKNERINYRYFTRQQF